MSRPKELGGNIPVEAGVEEVVPLTQRFLQPSFRILNQAVLPLVRRGFGSPLPLGFGLVVLETTGQRSGIARSVPVVAFRVGRRVAVSTVRANSQWVKNLEADSAAALWRNGTRRGVVADVCRSALTVVTLTEATQASPGW